MRFWLALVFMFGALVAPAGAVVGGERIAPEAVPWFVGVHACGGTLVAPDRVLTATHCVGEMSPAEVGRVSVGGDLRTVTRVAMHPGFRVRNGTNYRDDVAIVGLDRPVSNVTPVVL